MIMSILSSLSITTPDNTPVGDNSAVKSFLPEIVPCRDSVAASFDSISLIKINFLLNSEPMWGDNRIDISGNGS